MRHGLWLGHLWLIANRIELTASEIGGVIVSCDHRVALKGASSLSLRRFQRHLILLDFSHLLELPLEILVFNSQVLHDFILETKRTTHRGEIERSHETFGIMRQLTALTRLVLRKLQF